MNSTIYLEIYTPVGKYFAGDVEFISTTSSVAVLGILPDHAPLVTTLEISKLTIRINQKEYNYAIGGGILNIKKDNKAVMLLNSIERSDEIDVARALEAKNRAEQRLANNSDEIDVKRAQAALNRALNRINIGGQ